MKRFTILAALCALLALPALGQFEPAPPAGGGSGSGSGDATSIDGETVTVTTPASGDLIQYLTDHFANVALSALGLTGADIANTPAGSIASTDVQAALNELDTEKATLLANTFTRGQTIDGTADEVQLAVEANATQTANIQEWRESGGAVLSSIGPTGAFSHPTGNAESFGAGATAIGNSVAFGKGANAADNRIDGDWYSAPTPVAARATVVGEGAIDRPANKRRSLGTATNSQPQAARHWNRRLPLNV